MSSAIVTQPNRLSPGRERHDSGRHVRRDDRAKSFALVRDADAPSRILDLTIHDHVIVGNGTEQFVSLDERGLI